MIGEDPAIVRALPGRRIGHGLVLGKFMPPTEGHLYLIRFALESCARVTVVVGTLPEEPIPGVLRYEWIREIFPGAEVVHLDKIMPQAPAHPDDRAFFELWAETLRACCGGASPDAMFASEDYGYKVAAAMNIRFIPVDTARESIGISGTAMRQDPFLQWEHLHPVIRPYYLKRIAVLGPSTPQKAQLLRDLARLFDTRFVTDYRDKLLADFARNLPGFTERQLQADDLETMARGQIAGEDALARQSRRLLFTALDLRSLGDWGLARFGAPPAPWIAEEAARRRYDLYLLPADAGAGWWEAADIPLLRLPEEDAAAKAAAALRARFPGLPPAA